MTGSLPNVNGHSLNMPAGLPLGRDEGVDRARADRDLTRASFFFWLLACHELSAFALCSSTWVFLLYCVAVVASYRSPLIGRIRGALFRRLSVLATAGLPAITRE